MKCRAPAGRDSIGPSGISGTAPTAHWHALIPRVVEKDAEAEAVRGGPPPVGPLVTPGSYTVQLARRSGTTITPIGAPQRLQVIPMEGTRL